MATLMLAQNTMAGTRTVRKPKATGHFEWVKPKGGHGPRR